MIGGRGGPADPLRNTGLAAQMLDHENKRDNAPVSSRQRKTAYVAIVVLVIFLIAVAILFIT